MKRALAKLLAVVAAFLAIYWAFIWPVKLFLPHFAHEWSGAICGGIGALLSNYGGRFFGRRWPKSKAGWSK